jgi:hypothetical protein
MAVRIKQTSKPAAYVPRFDFDSSQASADDQRATLKELLNELNRQKADESTADYNVDSLETTLRFASSISSIAIPRRVGSKFPVTTLKTIKLLFKCSQFVDSHLMRVLAFPGPNSPATVDFFTSPPTPETEDVKRRITRMISTLEKELRESEIADIGDICDPMRSRERFRQDTNEAVDKLLLTHIHVDDDLMEKADAYLTEKTQEFHRSIIPLKREPRLHVATYTYLKLLDYVHRLHFEIDTKLTIANDPGVVNKLVDFTRICNTLSELQKKTIAKDTNFMAIDDASAFISDHPSAIARLVSDATGLTYNKRDVAKDRNRAMISLQLYLSSADLPNEHNSKPIGVVHLVAAYCSIRHQRKHNSKPRKTSKKYDSQLTAQSLLDEYIAGRATHIPGTVTFKYLTRTRWYVHALLQRKRRADSHIAVQIAQSELSLDLLMTLDHVQIRKNLTAYREFMTNAAQDFVRLNGRQQDVYEWKHGG